MPVHRSKGDSLDLAERLLDKGLIVDGWRDLSLAGLKLGSVDQRFTAASMETSLRYAEHLGLIELSNPAEIHRRGARNRRRSSPRRSGKATP
jgi:hypothetical protein